MQMDPYHGHIVEGNVAMRLRKYIPGGQVGHSQTAGSPGRNEPNVGELNYPYPRYYLNSVATKGG